MNRRVALSLSIVAFFATGCAPGRDDTAWLVISAGEFLRVEDGEDEWGPYSHHYYGLVLSRKHREIVLSYERWPDNLPRVFPGDRVHLLTDLATIKRNDWGYELDAVKLSIIQQESEF